jgi:hypothetical protein
MNTNSMKTLFVLSCAAGVTSLMACASAQSAGDAISAAAAPAAEAAAADAEAAAKDTAADVKAEAESQANAEVAGMAPDKAKFTEHAGAHIKYPADKAAIVAACAETEEFTDGEKAWVTGKLADGTYDSADALVKALWPEEAAEGEAAEGEAAASE